MHNVLNPIGMRQSIHPIEFREILPEECLVFLAGPIRGTSNWRDLAMDIISGRMPDARIVFASPDRINDRKILTPGNEDFFVRQRNWEQYYLRKAVEKSIEKKGVILFYLPKQDAPLSEENHLQKKAYGAITHIELGQLMIAHPDALAIGIDPEYPERSTIVNDIRQLDYLDLSVPYDHNRLSKFPVYENLADVCSRAVEKLIGNI